MRVNVAAFFLCMFALASAACGSSANREPESDPGAANSNVASKSSQPDSSADGKESAPDADRTATNGGHYRINANESSLIARVGVGGLFSALGHEHTIAIRGISGDVHLTPGSIQPASLNMAIRVSSLAEVGKEFSDKDRQGVDRAIQEEALEANKYPEIVFKSTSIAVTKLGDARYQARITGELTLHGATHPISFPAQVSIEGRMLRASGEFSISHGDYRIKRLSAGAGTVKAKDAIRLSFKVTADEL